MKIIIKQKEAGERLDKFLSVKIKDKTRSQIEKMINNKAVFVNAKTAKASYRIKEADIVEYKTISIKQQKKEDKKIEPKDKTLFKKIKIVAETDDYLVLNKPAGLVAHGAPHIKGVSLADWLLKKYPKLKEVGEDPERPGIVHRLDKEASGLMVVAKNQDSYKSLKKQFKGRQTEKWYKALVYGVTSKDYDEINFPIKRAADGNRQAAVPENFHDHKDESREAITVFEVEKRYINYTLLNVRIKTGRKHQIRVHLQAYGCPLVGDHLYNTKKTREQNKKADLNRLFLVAVKLAFKDRQGKRQEFQIDLPKDLKNFLTLIK